MKAPIVSPEYNTFTESINSLTQVFTVTGSGPLRQGFHTELRINHKTLNLSL